MPPPPALPWGPPPTVPTAGGKKARGRSVEHLVVGGVLAVVVLGAAGWLLVKPASSPAPAAQPQVNPAAAGKTPTGMVVLPNASAVPPTATAVRAVKVATKSKSPSRAAYLKAGNALCVVLDNNIKGLGPFPDGKPGGAYVLKLIRLVQGNQVHMNRLHAPAEDAARLQRIQTTLARVLALDRKLATAIAENNETEIIKVVPTLNSTESQLGAQYRAYGLLDCAA